MHALAGLLADKQDGWLPVPAKGLALVPPTATLKMTEFGVAMRAWRITSKVRDRGNQELPVGLVLISNRENLRQHRGGFSVGIFHWGRAVEARLAEAEVRD
jgi:hypothetical protein